ncbi:MULTISPECIES: hypothetical protein, partial [Pseudomonas]|uniref:hypothetical protein n=1 Tax=Pseudomonas TaxID=286 RepID=UPI001E593084
KPSALSFDFRLGKFLMQRLAIPSDYVLQFILGRASYVLPWEDIGGAAQDELQDVIRRYGETLHEEFS